MVKQKKKKYCKNRLTAANEEFEGIKEAQNDAIDKFERKQ